MPSRSARRSPGWQRGERCGGTAATAPGPAGLRAGIDPAARSVPVVLPPTCRRGVRVTAPAVTWPTVRDRGFVWRMARGRGPLGPGRRLVRGDELGPWPSSPGRSGVAFPRPGCLLLVPPSVDPTAVGGVVAREPGGAAVRGAGPTGPEGPRHRLGASSRASVGQQHCHARIVPDPATANPPKTLERQPGQALTTGDGSPDRGPGRTAAGPAWSNRARRIVIRTLAGPRATPDTPEPWCLCAVLGAGHAGRDEGQGCKLLVQASARPGPRAVLAVPVELAGGAGRRARQLSGATPSVGRQRDDRRAGIRWGAGQSP